LTGGGDLSADRTFALTTPGTLTVSSTNNAAGSHTHAITASSDVGTTPAAALLKSGASGELTLNNGFFAQGAQSSATFASGFAGSGWRADYGVTTASRASIEADDLTVRGRMRIYELLIQQIRATNGSLFVSSASKVVAVTATSTNPTWQVNGSQLTFNGSNANFVTILYTISTAQAGDTSRELYHGFLVGDLIRAQQTRWNGSTFAGTILSNMEVTSVANLYTYTGAFLGTDAPAVGYDFVRIGSASNTNRQGSVYITSDDSAAPFIDIIDGVYSHAVWNSAAVSRVRVGKLTGISDSAFGGALSGYGLYGNNVYLRGQIVVTGGSLGGMAANDVNNNSTTINGSRITTGTVTANEIAANTITAGNIAAGTITSTEIAANTITASNIAANTITGNKLSLTTTIGINSTTFGNAGIQLDYNAGSPRFYAGNGSSSFLQYNGTNVSMTGFITATGGSFTGAVYCGSNNNRFSTDGIRMKLPTTSSANISTDPAAFRWFADLDVTPSSAIDFVGMVGYYNTASGASVVDAVTTSYIGTSNYASRDARVILQAGHNDGSYTDARLEVVRERGTGAKYVGIYGDRLEVNGAIGVGIITAPGASWAGGALIYVDTADGDLKVRFANNTVKTLATN